MEILLILILAFILVPLLKVGYQVWRSVHGIKKEFNRQYKQYNEAYAGAQADTNTNGHHHRGKKTFDKSVGEYVDFEEIKEERHVSETVSDETPCDPIITDAEFEDVN